MQNKGRCKPLFSYPPDPRTRCGLGGNEGYLGENTSSRGWARRLRNSYDCLLLPRVGYWVLFPYVTNFTVTKVITCFHLNLKIEKGCITLLSFKQPSSAHPSSHDALQMTVSTVQCSNIREFWNFSFCNWKFGLLRRLNKIQRSFQKKTLQKPTPFVTTAILKEI